MLFLSSFSHAGPDDQVYAKPTPLPLESDKIPCIVNDFRIAARNAIKAGFDGIEINASSGGYLIDEFMNDQVHGWTDEYDETIKDSCRLALEIVEAVANEIGADKIGIKLSPFDGKKDSNSEALATYMANELSNLGVLVNLDLLSLMVNVKWSINLNNLMTTLRKQNASMTAFNVTCKAAQESHGIKKGS
ncbi:12-oxophytodienoate reductase-like protein [Solanum pennellii]|uniref:12-oxophytodienoate reductase-like protein n=1 Tax=Solanum pennellii TaxID=28526 RepID=A0ABM1V1X1_SOLPN|nr:12-oxophytodienoate reductase-like protein [Solanum pennellii]